MPEPYIPLAPTTKVAGRVAAIPKGIWNSATEYKKLDIITHDHRAYMAKKTSVNQMPIGESDEYWMMLVESFVEEFIGATNLSDGHVGLVPEPKAGDQDKVLRGDGDWGPKLQFDVIKKDGLYGYVNNDNDFVAFQSQDDVKAIVAELLIPEDAKESLDTLKEIADWIQEHPDDAADMNSRIREIEDSYYKKTGGIISGDVKIEGNLTLDNPLDIPSGGTGADTAKGARVNLNVPNSDIIAPVEPDEISDRVYEVGDHFIFDDTLCEVTKAIAVGDEIVIGTGNENVNVLIIDPKGELEALPYPLPGSSDDYTSSDDIDDDSEYISELDISVTSDSVIFSGTGNGTEEIFVISSNMLDHDNIVVNRSYVFGVGSGYSASGVTITPKFLLYEGDDLVDTVDSFKLANYPSVDSVKAVYIYTISGAINLSLNPTVHTDENLVNCKISSTIEAQIKEHSIDILDIKEELAETLPISKGGTGVTTAEEALDVLNGIPTSMVANKEIASSAHAYAVSDQLIYNGVLYTVISPISVGGTLDIGTNIIPSDTILDQIKAASSAGTDMTGATAESDGYHGLAPAPSAGDQDKFLKGDGSWSNVNTNFVGTIEEWNYLSLDEKLKYKTADIV